MNLTLAWRPPVSSEIGSSKGDQMGGFKASLKLSLGSKSKTEAEIYTYLKDGTKLCRMIGIVVKGTVLKNITYR